MGSTRLKQSHYHFDPDKTTGSTRFVPTLRSCSPPWMNHVKRDQVKEISWSFSTSFAFRGSVHEEDGAYKFA